MNKALVLATMLLALPRAGVADCVPAPADLLSWWPADGSGTDITGGNNGTLLNGVGFATSFVTSGTGQAFSFDGVDDAIDVGDVDSLEGLPQATIDFWMRTSNIDQTGAVTAGTHLIAKADGLTFPFQVILCNGDTVGVDFRGTTGSDTRHTADSPILADSWTHIAAVFDNSQAPADIVRIYLNGLLQSGTSTSSGCMSTVETNIATGELMASTSTKIVIGGRDDNILGITSFFQGEIDEVEFFDRALSASEIQAIVTAGAAGKCRKSLVEIDIKPGSDPNSINLRSNGVIPVAILTTNDFDAWEVDPASIVFGPGSAGILHAQGHAEDVDGDGDLDMVIHFKNRETEIACGDADATLSAETFSHETIEGSDLIRMVGCQ